MSGTGGRGGKSPHHFRPPSPYAPSPPPRLGGPDYGSRPPSMPCPRPRWPSPAPTASSPAFNQAPKPFRLPMHPPSPAPMRCASPEYYRGMSPYETIHRVASPLSPPEVGLSSREYEFVGVPLEPPPLPQNYDPDEEDSGPSTAEIIASQSQDYVDEKLAEYQATIYQLQGRTFACADPLSFSCCMYQGH